MEIKNNEEKDELIPFKVIKEDWNEYEVEDGSIIRTKFVLMNIIKTPTKNEQGQNLVLHQSQNLIAVFAPEKIRGKKDQNYSVEKLEKHIKKKNLFFRQIKENGMNKYETKQYSIQISNKLRQIDLTSKYDAMGYPAYIVRSETQIIISEEHQNT